MDTEDELASYLDALERDACYRVDAVLKEGALETTERVSFVGENGSVLGPFVRKRIGGESGLGGAYETVFAAQRRGVRLAHLPRMVECHRRDGDLVVVMEYVPGETLGSRVEACRSREERLALVQRAFPDLCDAVSELHELLDPPVIHRDLKPGNVIVSPGGVTLIDLGIARAYRDGAEQDTTHFGTRAYAPPEQFGFGQTGVTSDVYALGMLLFFCVTGREPSQVDRESGFRDAVLPEGLRAVVRRATELDPSARYASVRELKSAFFSALDGEPAVPEGPAEKNGELAPAPPDFAEPYATRGGGGLFWSWLARVPGWAGAVWDAVVLGVAALCVVGCVMGVVQPTPENAKWPTWYLWTSYLVFLMPMLLIACYLLLDRRPVRRAVPALARFSVRQETRVGLLALIAIFVAWVLTSAAAGM